MAKADLTKTVAPGGYAAAGVAVTFTAPDAVDGGQFTAQGSDLLLIKNTDAAPQTYTITSTADPYGRVKHITAQAIAAGAEHVFGPLPQTGWVQADGKIYVTASAVTVLFAPVKLPG